MKNILIIVIALYSIHNKAQDITYSDVEKIIIPTVKSVFPSRFNSNINTKDMFDGLCSQNPSYCKKMLFEKFTDIRITKVIPVQYDFDGSVEFYHIAFDIDFYYSKGRKDFYGTATLLARLDKVLNQYSVTHLEFLKTSGRHHGFKHKDKSSVVLLSERTK